MKMTKRIMAMAACAVMTASSMVGIGASAACVDTDNTSVTSEQNATRSTGFYENVDVPGSYINITSFSSVNAYCYLCKVYTDSGKLISANDVEMVVSTGNDFVITLPAGTYACNDGTGNKEDVSIQGTFNSPYFFSKITTSYGETYQK